MNKLTLCIACTVAWANLQISWAASTSARQFNLERAHFLKSLATVYDPSFWISYNGAFYFVPRTEAQLENLAAMKAVRDSYTALTNRQARHAIASSALARSGIGEKSQSKLLLPYSTTNENLTPTRELTVRFVPAYEVLTNFHGGDALIATDEEVLFVMDYGRAADDLYRTNAVLVREGTKSFKAPTGLYLQAEAFTNAGLSKAEIDIFERVVKSFMREAVFPSSNALATASKPSPPAAKNVRLVAPPKKEEPAAAEAEFQILKKRANDHSPYLQFLVAKHYLEGTGTPKDAKLAMEWMERAARNGSGDAKAFLQASKNSSP